MNALTLDDFFAAYAPAPEHRRVAALTAGMAALLGNPASASPGRALSIIEAARRAGCSRSTLYRALEIGAIRAVPLYAGGRPRILESELNRFLSGRKA